MSKISQKEVERIASLARIGLTDKEKEKMSEELGSILGYLDKLQEVNTDGVEPVSNITGLENVMGKDEAMKKPLEDQAADAGKLIEAAPDKKDNFVKVKSVFGE